MGPEHLRELLIYVLSDTWFIHLWCCMLVASLWDLLVCVIKFG